jgi:hypothetical protein
VTTNSQARVRVRSLALMPTESDEPELSAGTEARLSLDTTVRMLLAGLGLVASVGVILYLFAPAIMR